MCWKRDVAINELGDRIDKLEEKNLEKEKEEIQALCDAFAYSCEEIKTLSQYRKIIEEVIVIINKANHTILKLWLYNPRIKLSEQNHDIILE